MKKPNVEIIKWKTNHELLFFKTTVKKNWLKINCLNRTKAKDKEQSGKVNFKLIIII